MYVDYGNIGTSTAATISYTDDMLWVNGSAASADTSSFRVLKNRGNQPEPVSGCSITYDPIKKEFVVDRGLEYQLQKFKTKRSAKRYVKRWEGGRIKAVDVLTKMKAKNEENKIRIAREVREAREYAEMVERMRIEAAVREERMRLEIEAAELEEERLENENEEDYYFERLGL